jgi:hypothetical protein
MARTGRGSGRCWGTPCGAREPVRLAPSDLLAEVRAAFVQVGIPAGPVQSQDGTGLAAENTASERARPPIASGNLLGEEHIPRDAAIVKDPVQGEGDVATVLRGAQLAQEVACTVANEAQHAQGALGGEIERQDSRECPVGAATGRNERPLVSAPAAPPRRSPGGGGKDVAEAFGELVPFRTILACVRPLDAQLCPPRAELCFRC